MRNSKTSKESDRFREFTKKLVAVPKKEIDKELEREKQAKDKKREKKEA